MSVSAEHYIFEVPIYICKRDSYYDTLEKAKQKFLADFYIQCGRVSREQAPDTYMHAEDIFVREYGGPWQYNQAIGWLRLYVLGTQIRGEIWFTAAKRIRRNLTKKPFRWLGKAFELHIAPTDISAEIFDKLQRALGKLDNEQPFQGRHIDLEVFHNIGPFVNWRLLLDTASEDRMSRRS